MLSVCYGLDTGCYDFGLHIGSHDFSRLTRSLGELWSSTVDLPGFCPACVAVWLLDVAAAPRRAFRSAAASPERVGHGIALACYAVGPVFWMALSAACVLTVRKMPWIGEVIDRVGLLDDRFRRQMRVLLSSWLARCS
jgi:hypothetical protein